MNINTITSKGEVGEPRPAPKYFERVKVSPALLSQAVRVYLGNQRRASAKTKTRSEVSKTTAKMFRQKGTGNARHGSYAAPVFVGGGVAHGPNGKQNFSRKMSKALTGRALLGAVGDRIKGGRVWILQDAQNMDGKTKTAAGLIKMVKEMRKPVLAIFTKSQEGVSRGFKNISDVDLIRPEQINTYIVLRCASILASKEAWEKLGEQIGRYVD